MQKRISVIERTRKTASNILSASLSNVRGKTEKEIRDRILEETAKHAELFPTGWYDPPPGGIAVLFDNVPYKRLQFDTLRKEEAWPAESRCESESVGIVYLSPVDKATGMFGDTGLTLYSGQDENIRQHLKTCLQLVLGVAEKAEVGMRFNDLYAFAMDHFRAEGQKMIGWMTTTHDPLKINLGHTVPGSYDDGTVLGVTFEDTKEAIRSRRVYINQEEAFMIPPTCAFTVEARLTDLEAKLPNAFFHVIVTFTDGRKRVLTDFDTVFRTAGMDYML
ncbi:MAG TPA: hypothetical protein VJH91_02325 [Candidatus Paceibacterota bacterium]